MLNDLSDVVVQTVEQKKNDFGAALILDPTAVTIVGGSIVADGKKLEGVLKKLLAEAEKDKLTQLKPETYEGFHLYGLSLDVPDEKMVPFIGNTLDVVAAIGNNKVFVASGRDAAATLKKAIDKCKSESGKEIPAGQLVATGSKIAKFASEVSDDEQAKAVAAGLAETLAKSDGKDHVILTLQPITNGCRIRWELEEGILKAIGSAAPPVGPGM